MIRFALLLAGLCLLAVGCGESKTERFESIFERSGNSSLHSHDAGVSSTTTTTTTPTSSSEGEMGGSSKSGGGEMGGDSKSGGSSSSGGSGKSGMGGMSGGESGSSGTTSGTSGTGTTTPPATGGTPGSACTSDSTCVAGGSGTPKCVTDWPDGYCIVEACAAHGHDCPNDPGLVTTATSGSKCVLAPTERCLNLCGSDSDCRTGYSCQAKDDAAGHGTVQVCLPK
jgi:hypothetical protein